MVGGSCGANGFFYYFHAVERRFCLNGLGINLNERKTKTGAFAPVFVWTKEVFRT